MGFCFGGFWFYFGGFVSHFWRQMRNAGSELNAPRCHWVESHGGLVRRAAAGFRRSRDPHGEPQAKSVGAFLVSLSSAPPTTMGRGMIGLIRDTHRTDGPNCGSDPPTETYVRFGHRSTPPRALHEIMRGGHTRTHTQQKERASPQGCKPRAAASESSHERKRAGSVYSAGCPIILSSSAVDGRRR